MTILGILHVAVLGLLCAVALGLGVAGAVRPSERRLAILRLVSLATVFACLSAICGGISALTRTFAVGPRTAEAAGLVWAGLSEAFVPGALGFGVLAVAWGLAAIGLRRQP